MPLWLRLELQDDFGDANWLIDLVYELLTWTRMRAEMLLPMDREGFEDIDKAAEHELRED